MPIDLTKLTPAPWTFGNGDEDPACDEFVYAGGEWGAGNLVEHFKKDAATPGCWEGIKADAEFIALARNAFDIMMRRGWSALYQPNGEWGVFDADYADAEAIIPFDCGVQRYFSDPFSALVEADAWYREHVEGKT